MRANLAATARIKAVAQQLEPHIRAHPREQRQETARQEIEGWRRVVVSPADDAHATAEIFLRMLDRLNEHGVNDLAGARLFNFNPNGDC
jgi:hypothetical protein